MTSKNDSIEINDDTLSGAEDSFIIPENVKMPDAVKREVYLLHSEISRLSDFIEDYMKNVEALWENDIKCYVNSGDCCILEELMDDYRGYERFIELMTERNVKFKIIRTTMRRLTRRLEFIKMTYSF